MASEKLLLILIIAIIIGMIIVIKGMIKRKKEIRKREFEQAKRNDMFPIPKHLKDIFVLVGEKSSEYRVDGIIRCSCACECFYVKKDGDPKVITAVCKDCDKEYLIFDENKHGYDGFVCPGLYGPHDELKPWYCPKCNNVIYNIKIRITSLGKQDFIENIAYDAIEICEDDWVEVFNMINIRVNCIECGYQDVIWFYPL